MPEQVKVRRPKEAETTEETITDEDIAKAKAAGSTAIEGAQTETEEKRKQIDDLLGEIDDLLEENAADFARAYVQKGGQ